ncbi:MAG: U32 family peptidase [Candidatus Gastranaerophilales bacterium]|nr:U32 family peptidase [Candidatus Gastranaerophilales bacterium]
MQTELLAPAKNIAIAISAINCGADAIYIGSTSFGARKNAANALDDIKYLTDYAHKFYVKIYVTVNTIISDDEINDVKQLIKNLYDIGVDALIVQDTAILKMSIDGDIPPIPLHISTQCDNRSEEKIGFFAKIGVPRVVLARELSLTNIKNITEKYSDIEIETFIHGALCVSYSGQCYMSCYIGGRSANKGECAQPCRKKYSLIDDKGNLIAKDKHLLSLKDLNLSNSIEELVKSGVYSYKIEGRLKDELYVKNVVGYYRNLLDKYSKKSSSGKIELNFIPDLNKSFNRGYTDYFLHNRGECYNFNTPKSTGEKIGIVVKTDKKSFTVKLKNKIKLNPQDGLCFDVTGEKGCLINRVENGCTIFPNKMPDIKSGDMVYRNIDSEFEKSVLTAKTSRRIRADIKYKNHTLTAVDEDNNTVSVNITEMEQSSNPVKMKENLVKSLNKTGNSDFYTGNIEILTEPPFIPISKINEYRRTLLDKLMNERLANYSRDVPKPIKYAEYFQNKLDYRANVHNSLAKSFYNSCSVNITEKSFETKQPSRQVELMRTKHCIKYAFNMCKSGGRLFLRDEKGISYPLEFDCSACEMCVLSP